MKQNLRPSDVVLIRIREKPVFYAQISGITPDVKRGWYRVTLRSPFGEQQWILEDVHIFLGQTWTFQGVPHRMERVGDRARRPRGRAVLRRVK